MNKNSSDKTITVEKISTIVSDKKYTNGDKPTTTTVQNA
jgi:hypothetical protein